MRSLTHRRRAAATVMALTGLGLTELTGCDSAMTKEFREVATPAIQSGVSSILDGVVDGIFAVVEPDPDTDATNP